jgi:DNA-binding beta-propeller fold protein YncE
VSPDGQCAYVTNYLDDNVSQYDVGAGGEFSPKSPATVAAVRPSRIALSPPASVPTTKDQCKQGGWKQFGFKNRGDAFASSNTVRGSRPAGCG